MAAGGNETSGLTAAKGSSTSSSIRFEGRSLREGDWITTFAGTSVVVDVSRPRLSAAEAAEEAQIELKRASKPRTMEMRIQTGLKAAKIWETTEGELAKVVCVRKVCEHMNWYDGLTAQRA
ncbi:MAG: hypothetical protein ACTS4U_00355 [Candidatus Hodgkinia cicadicola]